MAATRIHNCAGSFVDESDDGTLLFHKPGLGAECFQIDPDAKTVTELPGKRVRPFSDFRALRIVAYGLSSHSDSLLKLQLITHDKKIHTLGWGYEPHCEALAKRLTGLGLPGVLRPTGWRAVFGLPAKL